MTKSVKEGVRMEEHMVEICEDLGDKIGKYSYFTKDRGVLFGLRNSKNLTEFLENMNSAQFKMPNEKYKGRLGIPKEFLLKIDDKNWRQYKSLITIFAKNPPAKKETGIEVEIISGLEEARLIYIGAIHSIPVFDKKNLLLINNLLF